MNRLEKHSPGSDSLRRMPGASCSACSTDRARAVPGTALTRRGTATAELALCLPVVVFFLVFMLALWRLTITEHRALHNAHLATAARSTGFFTLADLESHPEGFSPDRYPVAVEAPVVPGMTESTLLAYEFLPNMAAHAGASEYLPYISGLGIDFGDITLERDGLIVRPSWTYFAAPELTTQHAREADELHDWYFDARDATLPASTRSALGLRGSSTTP